MALLATAKGKGPWGFHQGTGNSYQFVKTTSQPNPLTCHFEWAVEKTIQVGLVRQ